MAKKWIRCDALLRDNEDLTSTECLSAILSGKIDVYTEAGRKLLNTNILAIKGPSTKPEIKKDAAECSKSLGCNVRIQIGSNPDNVFKPNDAAKKESIDARIECMRGIYYCIYPETAVLDSFIRFRRLLDCPKDLVVKELSRYMLKTDDAMRCFEILPAEDGAAAVADVQEADEAKVQEKIANIINASSLAASVTKWGEIHIAFVNDFSIEIHFRGEITNKTFDEIGFSDKRRKEKPNMSWFLLKQFAEERGELSPDDDISKNVSNLRKTIKSIFPHIPGDPIKHNQERRAYITSFATSSRIFRE